MEARNTLSMAFEGHPVQTPTAAAFCERPLFIVGTERSGSNLLRLVLNSHSALFIPHPPHVMHLMKPMETSYGNLCRTARFHELVTDVCRLVRSHTFPWDLHLDVDEVLHACRERTLFGVYAAVHEMYRRRVGKARWGCKSTFMIHESDAILSAYPQAQFIHLVRDPRDVAVSARFSVFNHFHPYFVAQRWAHEQQKAIRLQEMLPADRIVMLHYEDLIGHPEAELRALCGFLNEPFEPAMLTFFHTDEAQRSASLCRDWRNTGQNFMQNNLRKFLSGLSRRDVALMESVAEPQMRWCGYRPLCSEEERIRVARPGPLRFALYVLEEWVQKIRVEFESLRHDRNYRLRVRKWCVLQGLRLKSRWRRLGLYPRV